MARMGTSRLMFVMCLLIVHQQIVTGGLLMGASLYCSGGWQYNSLQGVCTQPLPADGADCSTLDSASVPQIIAGTEVCTLRTKDHQTGAMGGGGLLFRK